MKKSMMDRISRKKMSRRRMKNCGDTKGRERTAELLNTPFISEEENTTKGIMGICLKNKCSIHF